MSLDPKFILGGEDRALPLDRYITELEPLGPSWSDKFLSSPLVFSLLYTPTATLEDTSNADATYVIGRKGGGKTAYIHGEAIARGRYTFPLASNKVYSVLGRFRYQHDSIVGATGADDMATMWHVLVTHVALLAACRIRMSYSTPPADQVWSYVAAYGNPRSLDARELLHKVLEDIIRGLEDEGVGASLESLCEALGRSHVSFGDARGSLADLLFDDLKCELTVVIDNLEDLGKDLAEYERTLAGLFRFITTYPYGRRAAVETPFRVRLAFPAELFASIRRISSNPEKDFTSRRQLEWRAWMLREIANHRLFISLGHRESPFYVNSRIPDADIDTLLPADPIHTRLGRRESAHT